MFCPFQPSASPPLITDAPSAVAARQDDTLPDTAPPPPPVSPLPEDVGVGNYHQCCFHCFRLAVTIPVHSLVEARMLLGGV